VNKAESRGATPLYEASQSGHFNIVEALLTRDDINVNQPREDGCNSLIMASHQGHVEVVRLLLSQPDIDLNIKSFGKSALGWAIDQKHNDIVQLLIEAGATMSTPFSLEAKIK